MSNARFSILQSRAVRDKRVGDAQFRTLAALGLYGDKDGWCFPKLATLGADLGKSRQAVSKDIQELARLGYVEIMAQKREDGSRTNNKYRLLFDTPQPGVDTPQSGIDTHQRHDDTPQPQELIPLNLRGLHPSTSEVDALTPHINAPINAPLEREEKSAAPLFPTPFITDQQASNYFCAITQTAGIPGGEIEKVLPALHALYSLHQDCLGNYLKPFWLEFKKRYPRNARAFWLYDWAVAGVIPDPVKDRAGPAKKDAFAEALDRMTQKD